MQKIGEIKEPLYGYVQEIVVVPIDKLEVIEIQRKPSPYHIKRLAESIRKVGFVAPLITIRKGEQKLIVIDGQHRLLAARNMGIEQVPCIIVPDRFANEIMEFNIEKTMTLREKCYVALNLYKIFLSEKPNINENETEVMDAIEFSYFVTLGIAYENEQRFFGSAYESIMRRLDWFLNIPIKDAYEKRKERANFLIELDDLARKAVEKVQEIGINHPFLYKEIISFCNPIGRRRKIEEGFEDVMRALKSNIENLLSEPDKIREHRFSEEMEIQ